METKRNIWLWALYDFANSIVSIVFFLYFAQWAVIDRGISDFRFNLTFTVSALLLLLTVPLAGVLLDKGWRRIVGLRYSTILTVLLYGTCAICALLNRENLAIVLFTLGIYTYLLAFTYYTPLLNDIAPPSKRGLVSGIGIAANYLGQIVGLLIVLPFSSGSMSFFHASARAETLLPAVIVFFLLSLPTLLWFYEPKKVPTKKIIWKKEIREVLQETRRLFLIPSVAFFITAYFLFNDAILTAANNFPIFLEQVWHVPDATKTYILLGILITSVIGGGFSGWLADRYGHKRTLMYILAGWVFILPLVGWAANFTLFLTATTLMGFSFGANWAVSRSVMAYVCPPGKHNLAYAYFGLAERASSLVGPLVWGGIVTGLVSWGSDRYRYAALAITSFIVLGLYCLARVRDDRDGKLKH